MMFWILVIIVGSIIALSILISLSYVLNKPGWKITNLGSRPETKEDEPDVQLDITLLEINSVGSVLPLVSSGNSSNDENTMKEGESHE